MAAHTIGAEARWVQPASAGAPRTAAESARRPREDVGRRRGGLLVGKAEHDGGALWMQGVAHGSEPLGTGAGASGQGLPNLRYTNGTHLTSQQCAKARCWM